MPYLSTVYYILYVAYLLIYYKFYNMNLNVILLHILWLEKGVYPLKTFEILMTFCNPINLLIILFVVIELNRVKNYNLIL